MSSTDSRDDKISVVTESKPSRESVEGTGDRLNEAPRWFQSIEELMPEIKLRKHRLLLSFNSEKDASDAFDALISELSDQVW